MSKFRTSKIKLSGKEDPFKKFNIFHQFSLGEKVWLLSKNKMHYKLGIIVKKINKEIYEVKKKKGENEEKIKAYNRVNMFKTEEFDFSNENNDFIYLDNINEPVLLNLISEKFLNKKIYDFSLGKCIINVRPEGKSKGKSRIGESKRNFNNFLKINFTKKSEEDPIYKVNKMNYDCLLIMGTNHAGNFLKKKRYYF